MFRSRSRSYLREQKELILASGEESLPPAKAKAVPLRASRGRAGGEDTPEPARTGLPSVPSLPVQLADADITSELAAPEPFARMGEAQQRELIGEQVKRDGMRVASPLLAAGRLVYDANQTSLPAETSVSTAEAVTQANRESLEGAYGTVGEAALSAPPSGLTLRFDSHFEGGNLQKALQVTQFEYDLVLRPDLHTGHHTQWFYFSVGNMRAGCAYTLNMVNLIKPASMFNEGMLPVVFSRREAGRGWRRDAEATSGVCYYPNRVSGTGRSRRTYTLSFRLTARHDDDTLYVAYCYPYTYSDLQASLAAIARRPCVRRRLLCRTLAGNRCDLLTVTDFDAPAEQIRARRGVVLTARVHPGESNSSHVMEGCMRFLTGDSAAARRLRSAFIFKIVPMLNPDGVVLGNYRCSLAGCDLNRTWRSPGRGIHPTIYHTKEMVKRLAEDRQIVLFADFHGHSRRENSFMYGCPERGGAQRLVPALMERAFRENGRSEHMRRAFRLSDCSYRITPSKVTTARVVVKDELGVANSYTLESSFAGVGGGGGGDRGTHFSRADLHEIGRLFCYGVAAMTDQRQLELAQSDLDRTDSSVKTAEGGGMRVRVVRAKKGRAARRRRVTR